MAEQYLSWILVVGNVILILITAWYARAMWNTVKEMKREGEIRYKEKQLECLYMPIIHEILNNNYPGRGSDQKHYWSEIKKYSYLADEHLESLLSDFFILADSGEENRNVKMADLKRKIKEHAETKEKEIKNSLNRIIYK